MSVSIACAQIVDLDDLTVLFEAYRQFYEQPADLPGARAFLAERLRHGDSRIFLARNATAPLGFVQLYPSFTSTGMRRIWILNDLFVKAEARKSGIARMLMEHSARFAFADGAARLTLSTAHSNSAAQSLYENLGWQVDEDFRVYHLRAS